MQKKVPIEEVCPQNIANEHELHALLMIMYKEACTPMHRGQSDSFLTDCQCKRLWTNYYNFYPIAQVLTQLRTKNPSTYTEVFIHADNTRVDMVTILIEKTCMCQVGFYENKRNDRIEIIINMREIKDCTTSCMAGPAYLKCYEVLQEDSIHEILEQTHLQDSNTNCSINEKHPRISYTMVDHKTVGARLIRHRTNAWEAYEEEENKASTSVNSGEREDIAISPDPSMPFEIEMDECIFSPRSMSQTSRRMSV